jgi:hypothetical protein
MAQADRVHSTPPTNTSKITSADPTRRRLLTVAATATLTAAAAVDPVYAAIELHKDLAKTYDAAVKVRARCKDFGTMTPEELALESLWDPTGISHSTLTSMRDQPHLVQAQDWMEDEDGERYIDWRDAWLETLLQAVMQRVGERGAQKLQPAANVAPFDERHTFEASTNGGPPPQRVPGGEIHERLCVALRQGQIADEKGEGAG